jgi:hypothetical protein
VAGAHQVGRQQEGEGLEGAEEGQQESDGRRLGEGVNSGEWCIALPTA